MLKHSLDVYLENFTIYLSYHNVPLVNSMLNSQHIDPLLRRQISYHQVYHLVTNQ